MEVLTTKLQENSETRSPVFIFLNRGKRQYSSQTHGMFEILKKSTRLKKRCQS